MPEAESLLLPAAYPGLLAPPREFFDSLEHEQVQKEIQRFLSKKKWFSDTAERSGVFSHFISGLLYIHGLPDELLYIPFIESEFNPNALSRSGAAGLWQFMLNSVNPRMSINLWEDERYNFIVASQSALEKLLYNHSILKDWSLAIGAYNCGLARMQTILSQAKEKSFWSQEVQALLPEETKNYVPRILAAAYLAYHAGRLGLDREWHSATRWIQLHYQQLPNMSLLAQDLDIPLAVLLRFNPEYIFETPPPDQAPYEIRIPESLLPRLQKDNN